MNSDIYGYHPEIYGHWGLLQTLRYGFRVALLLYHCLCQTCVRQSVKFIGMSRSAHICDKNGMGRQYTLVKDGTFII